MKLKTEIDNRGLRILLVDQNNYLLTKLLKSYLTSFNNQVFVSPFPPLENLFSFNYCFLINLSNFKKIFDSQFKRFIFIFINEKKLAYKCRRIIERNNCKNVKIINIKGDTDFQKKNLEKILWFSLSKSKEIFLNLTQTFIIDKKKSVTKPKFISLLNFKEFLSINRVLFLSFTSFVIAFLSFIPPLIFSSFYIYKAGSYLTSGNLYQTATYVKRSEIYYNLSKSLYSFAKPVLNLFSLALTPDNIFEINHKSQAVINRSLLLYRNANQIIKLWLKKDKASSDLNNLNLRLTKTKSDLTELERDLVSLTQKLPQNLSYTRKIQSMLSKYYQIINEVNKFFPYLEEIFAKNKKKTYLILFANNMELRPGGGFIGSFGVIKLTNFTLEDLQIYDVYDADGQLIAHIEPPVAIRDYLGQPHWFLRDSAFSPDFVENYQQAKIFLEKELGLVNFDGAILLTTSAIQNILSVFDKVYLPDFNEMVTKDNFYLKTQLYAEKNFFPGSTQKKSFLASLSRQVLINLETISPVSLLEAVKKSLDEKQMLIYFEDTTVEKRIDSLYWSGRLIQSVCPAEIHDCLMDFVFPYDANLGVNKANFFINHFLESDINIDSQGKITNLITIKIKNYSKYNVFPGGIYKNYFQLIMPKNALIKSVTKNDVQVENYDQENEPIRKIGFLIEIQPQQSAEIKIIYELADKLKRGKNNYQLIVQKQIGSQNSDLIVKINLAKNISILNQNFLPLVKDREIIYNTTLSADKIFFAELIKE